MKQLNSVLESKFSEILSGQCLTSYREENRKILQNHLAEISESEPIQSYAFSKYVENFLKMKGYQILENDSQRIKASVNGETHDFFIDMDHGAHCDEMRLLISENGQKRGISTSESKYLIVVSASKKKIFIMSMNVLKTSAKEKKPGFSVLTEDSQSEKNKYLSIDLKSGASKHKAFAMK